MCGLGRTALCSSVSEAEMKAGLRVQRIGDGPEQRFFRSRAGMMSGWEAI